MARGLTNRANTYTRSVGMAAVGAWGDFSSVRRVHERIFTPAAEGRKGPSAQVGSRPSRKVMLSDISGISLGSVSRLACILSA
jgi:hypothetical protein